MIGDVTVHKNVRRLALEHAKEIRFHKFERVGASFIHAVEAHTRAFIRNRAEKHPSRGKTLT